MHATKRVAAWALRHGLGGLIAPVLNLAYAAKGGPRRRFAALPGGLWANQQDKASLVGPEFDTALFSDTEDMVRDYFEYDYELRQGDVIVDVGAGIGTEAVVFSGSIGPQGRILAIEAHPRIFAALEHTVRLSGLTNVTTVHAAVSDRKADIFISDADDYLGNSVSENANGIRVPAETLDTLVAQAGLTRIDLLKMNIEGAEIAAIRGMGQTIAMTRNVAISCHDFIAERGGDPDTRSYAIVEAFLLEQGFEVVKREADPRPWVRYTLYGSRSSEPPA